ncbi:hypothetical protein PWT90_06275 [Aphanocladium album]|nr:hypothetical protein PWT90_06275 [Aphanocladium album]
MTSQWPDWIQGLLDVRGGQGDVALNPLPSIHEPDDNETNNHSRRHPSEDIDPLQIVHPVVSGDSSRLSPNPSRASHPSTPNTWDISSSPRDSRSVATSQSNAGLASDEPKIVVRRRERRVVVTPSQDRLVHRRLRGIHLSMIAVNATLGTGLYWRGGQILELGGPLSTLLAFLLPGILAWAVMQCLTEMLCIWPIPGALSVYVSEFIDPELGIAIGITYWFTYAASFAALVATSAAEIHFWKQDDKAFDGAVLYFLIPLFLLALNCFRVDIYGWFEVVSSSIKLLFLFIVICFMVAINVGVWDKPVEYDRNAAENWFNSLAMSISIASFAYVGVEVVAASALEARWPNANTRTNTDLSERSNDELLIGQTVRFSSVYIPVLATIAYVVAGALASFNIRRGDCRLPRLSWVDSKECNSTSPVNNHTTYGVGSTTSAFVAIAIEAGMPPLEHVFNVFLVFTALTCAGTNLYVASRALFGLTTRLDDSPDQPLLLRFLAWFGKTNRHRVPMRAMIFSALSFWWVPFLQLHKKSTNISMFIEVLTTMASDSVIIVWAFECWAFIRYYNCIYKHRAALEALELSQVRRWDQRNYRDYPYRSHMQPFLGYMALGGCLFVLIIANSALLWKKFHPTPFLSTFLLQFVFFAICIVLKVFRGGSWSLVDLNTAERVADKIRKLHDIRLGAS